MPRRTVHQIPGIGAGQTHPCLFPQCGRYVPAALVACKDDWQRIPHRLRHDLKAAQQPGQTPLTATGEYAQALARVTAWVEREAAVEMAQ